jgi:uncharacterized membrane protein YqaE (UPF0057 family)
MTLFARFVFSVIFPPFAVLDKGCGTVLLVSVLTFTFWLPGVMAALAFTLMGMRDGSHERFVAIPTAGVEPDVRTVEERRKGAYVRLADGTQAEVVDDDFAPLEDDRSRKGHL